jgi:flagellar hook-length control protein FliK
MAARDGAGSARITLHPAELGSVEIRIRYQASGVSAELTAESQQAAQALQQSVGELRRALESQGLTVLDLDVRSAADDTQPRWKRDGSEGEERSQGGFADGSAEVVLDPLHVLVGTHVNVLA